MPQAASVSAGLLGVVVPRHRVERAAREQVRQGLPTFAAGLGVYYGCLAAFHFGFGVGGAGRVLTLACGATAAVLLAFYALTRNRRVPAEHAWGWAVAFACLVLANVTLYSLSSGGDPRNFVNYAMLGVVAGVLLLSPTVLALILVLSTAAWAGAAWVSGALSPFDGAFLAGSWVLAYVLQLTRLRALAATEAAVLRAEIALDRADRWMEQRDRAIDAHERSQLGLRLLIEQCTSGVLIVQNGVVAYANDAVRRRLGRGGEDLAGTRLLDLIHPSDTDLADVALQPHDHGQGVELRFSDPGGSPIALEVHAAPVEFGGGPAVLVVCTDDDSDTLDTRERQELANRMLAVGTLAAGVAHEINNPLAYTIANLEMAQIEIGDGDAARVAELLDVALEGAGRVRDIVADLRTFSREEELAITPVDVRDLLEASVRMAWNEIRHRAHLVRDYHDVPTVDANASRLGQVFLNLLVNAAQSIEDGDATGQTITIATREVDGLVVVTITDTGCGIPDALRERIFQPFFTTKPVGMGTGLGLPFCRDVIAGLGGMLSLTSGVGAGTTVSVALPASTGSALAVESPRPTRPRRTGPPRRILVIDDEAPLGEAIAAVLSSDEVVLAGSGAEALDHLADGPWDAILCDIMMPEMSGPELFRRIEAEHPQLVPRLAFITGGTFTEPTRQFLDVTTAPVLVKPFRARAIRDLVDQLANR